MVSRWTSTEGINAALLQAQIPALASCGMQHRPITVDQCSDGGGRCQDRGLAAVRSWHRGAPAFERVANQAIGHDESTAAFDDDDGAIWHLGVRRRPQDAVVSPHEAAARTVALRVQPLIQLRREQRRWRGDCAGHRIAIRRIIRRPTRRARPMTRGECDGIVEKEQWRPAPRTRQPPSPIAKLREAGDPQRAAVMADDLLSVVNDAAAVAGEHTARLDRVQVAPRIDAIATRHLRSLSQDLELSV